MQTTTDLKKIQTHIKYGFVTAIIIVILAVIFHLLGIDMESWIQYFIYAVFFTGLLINAFAYAKANDNYVTYGNVFSSCFKASAIVTIVAIAWALISLVVFPETKEQAIEIAQEKMAENQNMSQEDIDQGMEMMEKGLIPIMIGGILFSYMVLGAIFSLIAAAFPKKKGDGGAHRHH